jgi:hypothetical protein
MRLCHAGPGVMRHLEQMRLPALIAIYATLEEAIRTPWE